ncbi:MAG TPA: sulfite exporter TauE/SafE family protein [Pseudomonadales bacterium]
MSIEIVIVIAVVLTSMLSGVLGMAGGIILMALLVSLKSVAAAMIIHGVVQGTANGSRAFLLRKHIVLRILPPYLVGAAIAFGAFAVLMVMPNAEWVLIAIGALPWIALIVPKLNGLDVTRPPTATVCGTLVTAAQLFAGASGPLLDFFYLHTPLDRYQVVATKAVTQTLGHVLKLVYYGGVIGVASDGVNVPFLAIAVLGAVVGTRLGTRLLDKIGDGEFRRVSRYVILAIGAYCIADGVNGLL